MHFLQMSVYISFLLSLLHFFSTYFPLLEKWFLSKTLITSHVLQFNRKFKTSCYGVYKIQIVLKFFVFHTEFTSFFTNVEMLKSSFSEKAIKFEKISLLFWRYLTCSRHRNFQNIRIRIVQILFILSFCLIKSRTSSQQRHL